MMSYLYDLTINGTVKFIRASGEILTLKKVRIVSMKYKEGKIGLEPMQTAIKFELNGELLSSEDKWWQRIIPAIRFVVKGNLLKIPAK